MVYGAEVDVGSESRRGKSCISQVHIIKYINLSGQEEVSSPSIQAPIPLRLTNMVETSSNAQSIKLTKLASTERYSASSPRMMRLRRLPKMNC